MPPPGRVVTRSETGRIAADRERVAPEAAIALEADLRKALGDAVDFGASGRALFATDASNYRQVPLGVVSPRNRDEVIETVRLCRAHEVPIVPRGGGTSLAGQACNAAVAIDFSRHLHHLIELDPEARRARVEPGCILDTLRDAAEKHRLTFGPDPATHDHNTLGGMIGNDSCGVHSVTAHRTADNVERLTVLTYDGALLDLGPTDEAALARILAGGGREAEIYRGLLALRDRYGALIEARFPKIPRLVSGFENLNALLPGRDFNVARAVTGTEGSCVLVLDATLKLVPSPRCKALALLAFDDVFAAADAVPSILAEHPAALEGFDGKSYAALKRIGAPGMDLYPAGKGWLIVEAGGESKEEAERNVRGIAERSGHGGRCRIVSDPAAQKQIWAGREASLGATAFVAGQPAHWPGWEDSAVPPDRLGPYMRDLEALFARHGYTAALYGHFGDGVIHCRVDFDFRDEAGIANYRAFMRDAAQLVHGYGGSLSGEHGDGQARAELLNLMYGPELVQAFREFKSIWDPDNRMNPGKAIEPFPIDSNLRLGPKYQPPKLDTYFGFAGDGGSFAHATIRCVGVGKCRRRQVGEEVMCPSYLATGEEKHCTRGRTHLLHEMVRGEVIADGWRSDEVEEALSLCLACKGCKSDCPVGVDVATYKAEFRAHHYQGRLRPRAAYSMGLIQIWAKLAEPFPAFANLLTQSKLLSPLAKAIAGIDRRAPLPPFARQSFRRWFRKHKPAAGERVLLWPDTFNNHFRPETAIAAVRLLERAGFQVVIPSRPLCCGRPLYDWGFLDRAKRQFEAIFACLADDIEAGTPIIGLEPACTAAFKDELPNLFPNRPEAKRLSTQVVYFADFVAARADRFPTPDRGGKALVQPHCHHHAVIGFDAEKVLLDRLGVDVERPRQGCCGMAGAYGVARETYEVGCKIGERVLLPRVRELPPDTLILADGFSCREQIERHGGRPTLHIAQLLAERMLGPDRAPQTATD